MNNAYIRLLIYLYTSEKSSADYEIASVLLDAYARFPDILIEDIARLAHTSAATVTKFAHKLGYPGFKELRNDYQEQESNQNIKKQLTLAEDDYQQACQAYLQEECDKLSFYMKYHEEHQIQQAARMFVRAKNIGICYAHYAYSCVHVLRNYLTPFQKQVHGVLRDLEMDVIKERTIDCHLLLVISLQGDWVQEHKGLMEEWRAADKQVILMTAVYEEDFLQVADMVVPFQFIGDTILDSAHQISTFFIKAAFACANFPKLEKS